MNFSKSNLFKICSLALGSLVFIQCSDDEQTIIEPVVGEYFVGVEYGAEGAHFLSTATTLLGGVISPVDNGFEQLGWSNYVQGKDQIFSISGETLTSYNHSDNVTLEQGSSVTTDLGLYAWDVVDESTMIGIGSPWFSAGAKKVYLIDTDAMSITKTVETTLGDYANSETDYALSMPTNANVVGDYLFVSYYLYNADGGIDVDIAHVAVFTYPGLEFQKNITDDRVGDIGRYFSDFGAVKDENSDLYTISTSSLANGFKPTSTNKSGVLKIKSGETEFDQDFYIDFETLSGGYKLNDIYYAKNGKAVVRFVKDDSTEWSTYNPYNENPVLGFGVLDLYNETFTDLSSQMELSGGGWNGSALVDCNIVYVGVSNATYSGTYIIDVDSETVTEGADIDGNYAVALLKL